MTAYVYVIYWCTDIVVGIAATVDAAKQYCVKHNEGPITNPEWNYGPPASIQVNILHVHCSWEHMVPKYVSKADTQHCTAQQI
jgi:hypothetical protein